ncbi:MAG: protein-L-isoaspartate(D-aspartate) O-methyltransferase [bacterium]|nr:protein-L-isoaspartate(D-aspartate) O-methyltransferase [bacterium]
MTHERYWRSWGYSILNGAAVFAAAGLLALAGGLFGFASVDENALAVKRAEMVRDQIVARGIRNERVLEAMRSVPRHRFVPRGMEAAAYSDGALPIGEDQTISQPYIVALMTALIEPREDDRVLEIGTGSGYQAAVLAELVSEVYSIEILEPLARRAKRVLIDDLNYSNIHLRTGDGYRGWPEHAPYNGILVTAAPDHVPQPLKDQLAVGGRLVIPVGDSDQKLLVIEKLENGFKQRTVIPVRFVPMTGEAERR